MVRCGILVVWMFSGCVGVFVCILVFSFVDLVCGLILVFVLLVLIVLWVKFLKVVGGMFCLGICWELLLCVCVWFWKNCLMI